MCDLSSSEYQFLRQDAFGMVPTLIVDDISRDVDRVEISLEISRGMTGSEDNFRRKNKFKPLFPEQSNFTSNSQQFADLGLENIDFSSQDKPSFSSRSFTLPKCRSLNHTKPIDEACSDKTESLIRYFLRKAPRADSSLWDKSDQPAPETNQISPTEKIVTCNTLYPPGISFSGSMRLRNFVSPNTTVVFIDIKGFTSTCAELTAGQVGDWVADFYARVDAAAAAHGVRKAEVRGDCCICVAGSAPAVPWDDLSVSAARFHATDADTPHQQATRVLAFAASLHADLATMAGPGGRPTPVRMGAATGDAVFLVGEEAGGGGGFVSVQGEAARLAAALEAHAEPGRLLLHRSTAALWAAEAAGRRPPLLHPVGSSTAALEAAVYDCAARGFCHAAAPPSPKLFAAAAVAEVRPAADIRVAWLWGRRVSWSASESPRSFASEVEAPAPKRLARSHSFS